MKIIKKLFDPSQKKIKKYKKTLKIINDLAPSIEKKTDEELKAKTQEFKSILKNISDKENREKKLNEILPEAYAVFREASSRIVNQRHYDVQILSAISLHNGNISEQKTGEGKTLTATLPLYLNALTGRGAHLVTPNDYLSRSGAGWYGNVFESLGISVGVLIDQSSFKYDSSYTSTQFDDKYSKHLRPCERKEAYMCDITYATNNQLGFDYLYDNMATNLDGLVQVNSLGGYSSHNFAIVDEIDSILIDEARTPLIISQPDTNNTSDYLKYAGIAKRLITDTDYNVNEKDFNATLTELGIRKVEKIMGVDNLYEENFQAIKLVENALKAETLYKKDKQYVVQDGKVKIVDEFTGRILESNRFSSGIHQAIEAKENVVIQPESKTIATTSYQNFFRLYDKLAGMTGTAKTEEEEFFKIYGIEVVQIPTNKPVVRKDENDLIYKTESAKFAAVAKDIKERNKKGQPVLVGTTSVEKSELLSKFLKKLKVPHNILNAKHHTKEGLVIADAGKKGAVTVATNMAGRGVDIKLGGEDATSALENEIKDLGGLYVIGTERHESRRIDNQLRGRSGRQGDPGESVFYVSLQDDLMRIFGGDRVAAIMNKFKVDDNMPLSAGMVTKGISNAQKKVEGMNFDSRRHVLEYDDVMSVQRKVIYALRKNILLGYYTEEESKSGKKATYEKAYTKQEFIDYISSKLTDASSIRFKEYVELYKEEWLNFTKIDLLKIIDLLWMDHIDKLDDLRRGVGLRSYAQNDPLVEYKKESKVQFENLQDTIWNTLSERILKVEVKQAVEVEDTLSPEDINKIRNETKVTSTTEPEYGVQEEKKELEEQKIAQKTRDEIIENSLPYENKNKIGRNDICPCGCGKKYKKCPNNKL